MTERVAILGVALMLVALSLLSMWSAHERHYKNRKIQLLEGRVASLERIILGEHD